MVSRFVSMALAFALAATVSFAAGDSDSAGAAAAAEKKYVTDPTNGQVYTAPEYGGTLPIGSSFEPPNSDAMIGGTGRDLRPAASSRSSASRTGESTGA